MAAESTNTMSPPTQKKPIYKRWWFWVAAVVIAIIGYAAGGGGDSPSVAPSTPVQTTPSTSNSSAPAPVTIKITGGTLGEYGKEVTLNATSDSPTKKFLYKLPAGTYLVTTTNNKLATFWVVKDNAANTGMGNYPEELTIVSGEYALTAGNDDFGGRAKRELEVTLATDESIQTVGTDTFSFTMKRTT